MASAFTHAIASVAIGKLNFSSAQTWRFWVIGIFCAVVPDIDAIGFWMGVPYESLWGHRGITHSLFFSVILAAVMMFAFYRSEKVFSKPWWILYLTFFVCTASHGILDALTTGGRGVAFFAPFGLDRYFFKWRVIKVSPLNVASFFTYRGIAVLKTEFVWVWIPSFIIFMIATFVKKRISK